MMMEKEIKREIRVKSEKETEEFGIRLASELAVGDVLCLIGDLGTGKTTLTRYIAKGLGINERLNSPTFTIVKEYHSGRLPLYHFDVYRVSDIDELFNIGFEEYLFGEENFDDYTFLEGRHELGISVIEWADLILDELPEELEDHLKIIYISLDNETEESEENYLKDKEEETEGRIYRCTF